MKESSRATRARDQQRSNAHKDGEVVREALRLMEEQGQVRAARLLQLRADIKRGLDSGAGQPWEAQEAKRQARARRSAKVAVKT